MPGKATVLDRCLWRLGVLDPATPQRAHPHICAGIVGYHLLALLACVPWLFSWSGLAWAVAGLYLFGTLGINIGYHRLLTHRGFSCPPWLEKALALIGACCWQGTPLSWVAIHRMHHRHSDEADDPHSPRHNFFHSHMGWFLVYDPAVWSLSTYDRYARDLVSSRFYKWLERPRVWRLIHLVQWTSFLTAGFLVGCLWTWSVPRGVRLGLSWLVWGVLLRTVLVWHITWSVNSFTHVWGYRNFATDDNSRNNWVVGLLSNGEGWHNNHHAEPRCARHGRRWFELDVSYLTIRALQKAGLAWDVAEPKLTRGVHSPSEKRPAA
jgi:stearoyl-CoA desaturase (delta-9 desaturase)